MAGIYIHIPFCRQACTYCNFHFSTTLTLKDGVLEAIQNELVIRAGEIGDQEISSVYIGGGTPSLLTPGEINTLIDTITAHYAVSGQAEITLETNPDDLNPGYLSALKLTAVNRLSIGIQSFSDADLTFMHRAHEASQARAALATALDMDWQRLTVDLIYGTPGLSQTQWEQNLRTIADLDIPHLSAYQLTVEEGTALDYRIRKGTSAAPDDGQIFQQYMFLTEWAQTHGYEHYEISNLARPGHRAVHNSNYWNRTPYLGVGPSAHSFDGTRRSWNVAHNPRYLQLMSTGLAIEASEILTPADIYNETVMTGLRLKEGLAVQRLRDISQDHLSYFEGCAESFLNDGAMILVEHHYQLTIDGRLFADRIASDCFIDAAIPST